MDGGDLKRWLDNHRAAAARESEETQRNPPTPQQALAAAFVLLRFDEQQNGSPFARNDPVSQREDERVWTTWSELRARWPHGR